MPAGSVHRVPDGTAPFDHTSVLATFKRRFGLTPLTSRDATAPDVGDVSTPAAPRTDDPLAGVNAPTPPPNPPDLVIQPSHLQEVQEVGHPRSRLDALTTNADYEHYIRANGE